MTLDNMTGITEGSYTGFCKSQLITCNRVKECNGVCPFEDALKHADKTQTMNDQHTVDHDRDWIIGCIEHDGFIHTHRFDKANQIIHDALLADTSSDLISRANAVRWVKTECNPYGKPTLDYDSGLKFIEHLEKMPSKLPSAGAEWIPCSERLPSEDGQYLVCMNFEYDNMDVLKWTDGWNCFRYPDGKISRESEIDGVIAWMPLPKPYREDGEV